MYEAVLNHFRRYIDLTPEEESFYTSLLKYKQYRKGQLLLKEGEVCRYDTYMIKGVLRSYYIDDSGLEHIVMFCLEDKWLSDVDSYMNQAPAVLNIDVLENCEVFQFDRNNLDLLFQKIPKFESFFRKKFQKCFSMHQQRVVNALYLPGKERYLKFLEEHDGIEQRIPQHYIASYLGITPQFLSRLRSGLRAQKRVPPLLEEIHRN